MTEQMGALGPVSVIVPAFNAARFLPEQLAALSGQDRGIVGEIVVADNGSSDATRQVAARAAERDGRIRLLDASGVRGAAHARNAGAAAARGRFLAFCDADDVAAPGWAAALYRCAGRTGARLVAGRVDHDRLTPSQARRWPAAIHPAGASDPGAVAFAQACNLGITRDAFDAVRGFDETLRHAAEDVEFSRRLARAGIDPVYCPDAVVYYRDRTTLAAALTQAYRYGRGNHALRAAASEPRAAQEPRPLREVLGLIARMPDLATSVARRANWLRQAAFWCGYLAEAGPAAFRDLVHAPAYRP